MSSNNWITFSSGTDPLLAGAHAEHIASGKPFSATCALCAPDPSRARVEQDHRAQARAEAAARAQLDQQQWLDQQTPSRSVPWWQRQLHRRRPKIALADPAFMPELPPPVPALSPASPGLPVPPVSPVSRMSSLRTLPSRTSSQRTSTVSSRSRMSISSSHSSGSLTIVPSRHRRTVSFALPPTRVV